MYKFYGYDRNKVIRSSSTEFVNHINRTFNTLLITYTESDMFDIDVSEYVHDVSAKKMFREFVNRTRLCANDKTW